MAVVAEQDEHRVVEDAAVVEVDEKALQVRVRVPHQVVVVVAELAVEAERELRDIRVGVVEVTEPVQHHLMRGKGKRSHLLRKADQMKYYNI